ELLRRHESLRTTFQLDNDQPVQVIHPTGAFHLPVVDLGNLVESSKEATWLAEQERRQACDLACGPLIRIFLLRLSRDQHILLLTMHHIISDGWSLQVLRREITSLY